MSEQENNLNPEENFENENSTQNELTDNKLELDNNLDTPKDEKTELTAAEKILQKYSKTKPQEKEELTVIETVDEEDDEDEDPDNFDADDSEEKKEIKLKYQHQSRTELLDAFKNLTGDIDDETTKLNIEAIKNYFYKKRGEEYTLALEAFVAEGGHEEEFHFEDELENEFKNIVYTYKEKRRQKQEEAEKEKEKNYEAKLVVIEDLKNLVNGTESLNDTFSSFREIQQKWNEIGQVPQSRLKSLWETYHHHVQTFYDYVKINKELRDLDLKKNLEIKIQLCEQAEELLLEEKVVKAYKDLQMYHQQWREIGPVPNENKDEIWDRFKDVSAKINKRHQDYFEGLKDEQLNNLKAKVMICEEAEKLSERNLNTPKDWDETSRELIKLQDLWRAIGFAPKKDNNRIYNRFRKACDVFFNKKREFFSLHRQNQNQNLEQKTELCLQAEALQNSTDWKQSTELLIGLQKRWKGIGPVPRKYSDEIWQRFRAACNLFFERKEAHYKEIEHEQSDNLKLKEDLIIRLEALEANGLEQPALIAELKEIQNEWSKIGFVPRENKTTLFDRYKILINKFYDKMELNLDHKQNPAGYKTKLEDMNSHPHSKEKLKNERDKLAIKIQKLKNDITVWENNIGFFAQSKNAESMISGIKQKIEDAKKNLGELMEQLRMIDDLRKN
jgi:hypothetical protein